MDAMFWHSAFGPIIVNLVNNLFPSKYGCIISCMLTFHAYSIYVMGSKYVVHVHVELWMVRLHQMSHSNQNTQASI
jgi:hypothetical protein